MNGDPAHARDGARESTWNLSSPCTAGVNIIENFIPPEGGVNHAFHAPSSEGQKVPRVLCQEAGLVYMRVERKG